MNYYIQGDAAKAEQIKAAFEKKGIDVLDFGFADKTVVYCSIGGVCVQSLPYCINLMHILHSHPDYKELELPIEPKFKVGDKVIYGGKERTITFMDDKFYDFDGGCAGCRIELQDGLLRPVPKPHYDIANFKPFDKVLVRQNDSSTWGISFFGFFSGMYMCCSNVWYEQCIPYNDDTKHLLGTTDMPSEEYINW